MFSLPLSLESPLRLLRLSYFSGSLTDERTYPANRPHTARTCCRVKARGSRSSPRSVSRWLDDWHSMVPRPGRTFQTVQLNPHCKMRKRFPVSLNHPPLRERQLPLIRVCCTKRIPSDFPSPSVPHCAG